jgi:hypothetical protein
VDAVADTLERGRMMDELNHILKTYIDKVKAKAFAEGWNACLEEMPRVKTLKGFMIVDGTIFDSDKREFMWGEVQDCMAKQMLESLKKVVKYAIETNEEDNTVTIHGRIFVTESVPPLKKVIK